MFDTIRFYYDTVPDSYEQYLLEITEISYSDGKPHWKARKLDNFWIWTSSNGRLHVIGSLAKYQLGNNLECLTIQQCEEAVQSLCMKLMIPPHEAKITRLDFGANFKMKRSVIEYQDCMWSCPYLPRKTEGNTLYFGENSRVLTFYDKLEESKAKQARIPDCYLDSNLLRYECRYIGEINSRFKSSKFTLDMLYDESFFRQVIENYIIEFKKIDMLSGFNKDLENVSTTLELRNYYFSKLLYKNGPDVFTIDYEEIKSNSGHLESRDYSQLNRNVLDTLRKYSTNSTYSHVNELTHKVESVREMFASPAKV